MTYEELQTKYNQLQKAYEVLEAEIEEVKVYWKDAQRKNRELLTAANAVSEQAPKKLIGWRTADYLLETDDPEMAKNWDVHYEILPIFEGDANTKLTAAPKAQTTELVRVEALNKLGKRLAELLDEDQWAECEKLLISLRGEKPVVFNAVSRPQATEPAGYKLVPVEPTPEMLGCIVHSRYPEDWHAGKALQMNQRGESRVPFKTEYEIAVGQYQRMLAAAPEAP